VLFCSALIRLLNIDETSLSSLEDDELEDDEDDNSLSNAVNSSLASLLEEDSDLMRSAKSVFSAEVAVVLSVDDVSVVLAVTVESDVS
jgi:hypothetical protein